MKAMLAGAVFLGSQGIQAEDRPLPWQTPQEVLATLDAGVVPVKPQAWHSPRGQAVLHGDLFGDGRHLALVAGEGTSWAVVKEGAWKEAGRLDVVPVWVPPGKTPLEAGYAHCKPAAIPFVLKDLDGDRIPEVLVAFDSQTYLPGYAIARKDGDGIRLLELRSGRGEPDWIGGFLVANTLHSGRKAWWSGDTYCKWREGKPEPVATWIEDCHDPEKMRWIAVRHGAGGKDRAFELTQAGDSWIVQTCIWKQGVETAEEAAFATITIAAEPMEHPKLTSADIEQTVVFEMATGIPGSILWQRAFEAKDAGFDYDRMVSLCLAKVEGKDEAKMLLKRASE